MTTDAFTLLVRRSQTAATDSNSARFVYGGGERLGRRDVVPPSDQPPASVENENGEVVRRGRDTQLRDRFPVEIRNDKNIVARVTVDVFCSVSFLQLLRFRVQPAPDNRTHHSAKGRKDILLETDQLNQTVLRIAHIGARKVVAHSLRLVLVLSRHHGDNADVPVGGGKLLPI